MRLTLQEWFWDEEKHVRVDSDPLVVYMGDDINDARFALINKLDETSADDDYALSVMRWFDRAQVWKFDSCSLNKSLGGGLADEWALSFGVHH